MASAQHLPKFEEIGKQSREILTTFFDSGRLSFKAKMKECGNESLAECRLDPQSNQWRSSFASKVDFLPAYGLQAQRKVNSEGMLFAELALADSILFGTRVGVTGSLVPATGATAAALTANVIRHSVRLDVAMAEEKGRSVVSSSVVTKFDKLLLGYQFFGANHHDWLHNGNLCLGLQLGPGLEASLLKPLQGRQVTGTLTGKSATGSYDTAVRVLFDGQRTDFELGFLFKENSSPNWSTLLKVDSHLNVAAGLQAKLSDAVTVRLWSSLGDAGKGGLTWASLFTAGDRIKMGLGIECDI